MSNSRRLSKETIAFLEAIGWSFYPSGPNEWEWMKFNAADIRIARGGDATWFRDLARAEAPPKKWWHLW